MKTLPAFLLLIVASAAVAETPTPVGVTNPPPVSAAGAPSAAAPAPAQATPNAFTLADPALDPMARQVSPTLVTPEFKTEIKVGGDTLDGVAIQVVKTKKAWNLISPFAPMRYGSGTNNYVPGFAGGPPGINLFSCKR